MRTSPMSILTALFALVLGGCQGRSTDSSATATSDASGSASHAAGQTGTSAEPKGGDMVKVRVFNDNAVLGEPVAVARVVRSDAEWRRLLTAEQFAIARGKSTEAAYCGTLLDNKLEGVYACVCCRLPLFAADAKFDSGTGWPSFFRPIAAENVVEVADRSHGMVRDEIVCARCDGHLGHVFNDGPRPSGRRYCLNSESLTFTPTADLASLAEAAPRSDAPDGPTGSTPRRATAVLAGGCFWCVEAVFEELDGVFDAISGYAGGSADTANYEAVCSGRTDHAEAVQIVYDPAVIDFAKLLEVHFATHDPTTLNQQGADKGRQYRSAVFWSADAERELTQAFIDDLSAARVFDDPIVTTLERLTVFYPAEKYHQGYVCANPSAGYVRGVAWPKVEKVRKKFEDRLKAKSPLDR